MNNFHKNINFTEETMKNNSLIFLDMNLYIDNENKIQTKLYRKSENIVYNNFRQSIMPKSQKIATLAGEIYRTKYCCSTENDLEISLKNLEKIFLNNEYPKK